jgi:hypothetical protein
MENTAMAWPRPPGPLRTHSSVLRDALSTRHLTAPLRGGPAGPETRPECVVLPNHAPGAQRFLDLLSQSDRAQRSGAFSWPGALDAMILTSAVPSPACMAGSNGPGERSRRRCVHA